MYPPYSSVLPLDSHATSIYVPLPPITPVIAISESTAVVPPTCAAVPTSKLLECTIKLSLAELPNTFTCVALYP